MKFHILKSEKVQYWNNTEPIGELKRYLSIDKKIYISMESGPGHRWDYARIAIANKDGKGNFISEVYHQGNRHSYPIYSIKEIYKKFLELNLEMPYKFIIHESNFTKKIVEL